MPNGSEGSERTKVLMDTFGAYRIILYLAKNSPSYANKIGQNVDVARRKTTIALATLKEIEVIKPVKCRDRRTDCFELTPLGRKVDKVLRLMLPAIDKAFDPKQLADGGQQTSEPTE